MTEIYLLMKRKVQDYLLIYLFKSTQIYLQRFIYLLMEGSYLFSQCLFFLLEANIRIQFFVRAIIWRTSGEIFTGHSVI